MPSFRIVAVFQSDGVKVWWLKLDGLPGSIHTMFKVNETTSHIMKESSARPG